MSGLGSFQVNKASFAATGAQNLKGLVHTKLQELNTETSQSIGADMTRLTSVLETVLKARENTLFTGDLNTQEFSIQDGAVSGGANVLDIHQISQEVITEFLSQQAELSKDLLISPSGTTVQGITQETVSLLESKGLPSDTEATVQSEFADMTQLQTQFEGKKSTFSGDSGRAAFNTEAEALLRHQMSHLNNACDRTLTLLEKGSDADFPTKVALTKMLNGYKALAQSILSDLDNSDPTKKDDLLTAMYGVNQGDRSNTALSKAYDLLFLGTKYEDVFVKSILRPDVGQASAASKQASAPLQTALASVDAVLPSPASPVLPSSSAPVLPSPAVAHLGFADPLATQLYQDMLNYKPSSSQTFVQDLCDFSGRIDAFRGTTTAFAKLTAKFCELANKPHQQPLPASIQCENITTWQNGQSQTTDAKQAFKTGQAADVCGGYAQKSSVSRPTKPSDLQQNGWDPAIQPHLYVWGSNKGNDDRPFGQALGGGGQAGSFAPFQVPSGGGGSHPNYVGILTTKFGGASTRDEVIDDINKKFDLLEAYVKKGGVVHFPAPHGNPGIAGQGLGAGNAVSQNGSDHPAIEYVLAQRYLQLQHVAAVAAANT